MGDQDADFRTLAIQEPAGRLPAMHLTTRVVLTMTGLLLLPLADCHQASNGGGEVVMFTTDHDELTVPEESPLRTHLEVQAVGAAPASHTLQVPADIEADPARVANILAPLTGRVVALKVGLGDRVTKGQVLAIIASGDLAQASADVEKAQDAYNVAKKALDRAVGVRAAGGAADKDIEAAQSAVNQAQAELTRATTRMQVLGDGDAGNARQLMLDAPMTGVVTALALANGAQVTDPTAALMTVTNLEQVFVTANLAEGDVGKITVGTDADISLTAFPDQPLHGKVSQVNAQLEPDTRRQKIRIAMPNADQRLLPNMYGTVSFASAATGGAIVPQSALLMNNEAITVLVEVRPWVFQRRTIQVGNDSEAGVVVLSGLKIGERVVVKGGVLLSD
jgi:cobalt-zinc-cadmium efflux system membrane fusion protein